ncbi:MAG: Asp-tRNA(Asn)/Glu-tRNA(Gln) amidotransferase subunit GatC, partial [Acidobacteriota bacterium]|nr:Asp-tRNA(Asn)/Glu-tRNA(Gln) amidotransferase subunit GatC [Acidobacteriota bacterium]
RRLDRIWAAGRTNLARCALLNSWRLWTIFTLVIASVGCRAPRPLEADRVLVNGNIITVDARDSVVEALAIRGGRIVAVGTTAEIEALAGPDTERIDLAGRTATPGLLDLHCHFANGGLSSLYVLDLSYPNIESVEGATEKVKEQVDALGAGEWVVGRGWDEGKLLERRYIYARDLDPVSPDNPVLLTHTMGHYAVANSAALRMANITKETPDPFGGTIDRDEDGNPTGVLKETAQSLVGSLIPDATFEQRKKGIAHLARLHVAEEELPGYVGELSRILELVERMDAVPTDGVEPMAHPLDQTQRLRADEVTEDDQRELFQAAAPAVRDGLYLVPKVIE